MYCVRNITPDVLLLGGSDRRLSLFENVFPVPKIGRASCRERVLAGV